MEQLARQDVAAAAAAHQELGPEYSQAAIDSFLEKVDSEIAARMDARLGTAPKPRSQTADVATHHERRALWTGLVIGSVVAGIPLTLVALSNLAGIAVSNQEGTQRAVIAIWLAIALVYLVASRLYKPGGRE
jgi:hypothetical protein